MPKQNPDATPIRRNLKGSAAWHIILIVLILLGVGLLYWKFDNDTRAIRSKIGELQMENDRKEVSTPKENAAFSTSEYAINLPPEWVRSNINSFSFNLNNDARLAFVREPIGLPGWDRTNLEEYQNPHGVIFTIHHNEPHPPESEDSGLDPNERLILIISELTGERLMLYTYDAEKTPDALPFLFKILDSISPLP